MATFRSGFEHVVASALQQAGVTFGYESDTISFVQPEKKRKYTPDFWLDNGVILEAKGLLTLEDRQKHEMIKAQFPELDIRFVFQNPNNRITKGSKTRYRDWADKHGFRWCKGPLIPRTWTNNTKPKTTYRA